MFLRARACRRNVDTPRVRERIIADKTSLKYINITNDTEAGGDGDSGHCGRFFLLSCLQRVMRQSFNRNSQNPHLIPLRVTGSVDVLQSILIPDVVGWCGCLALLLELVII